MRKKTAPRTQRHQKASSHQQAGLIAKGESASPSAAEGSALANRSHRTRIRLTLLEYAGAAPHTSLGHASYRPAAGLG